MMWGYGYGNGMMGYSLFGVFFSLIWFVLMVVIAVALIRWIVGGRHGHHWMDRGATALDILKERYAKGEIDKSEFEEKKKDLI